MKPHVPTHEKDSDSHPEGHHLKQQIEAAQQRLDGLRQRADALSDYPKELLTESLEELSKTLAACRRNQHAGSADT